jgi:hypothetical protein
MNAVNEIKKYINQLHEQNLINILQHDEYSGKITFVSIIQTYSKVGCNFREEFDR